MIVSTVSARSAIVVALLAICTVSSFAYGDSDEKKLKDLNRAMSAPASEKIVKKPRTRAIVFDNEPALKPETVIQQKTEVATDCKSLPSNTKSTAVDFAIQFKVGSSEVAQASEQLLREIAKILALSPNRCVLVEGHTDVSGNADTNMALSRDRAEAVVNFVVDKAKLESKRFVSIGKGSSEPLKNLDPHHPLNRRVVFKVVD